MFEIFRFWHQKSMVLVLVVYLSVCRVDIYFESIPQLRYFYRKCLMYSNMLWSRRDREQRRQQLTSKATLYRPYKSLEERWKSSKRGRFDGVCVFVLFLFVSLLWKSSWQLVADEEARWLVCVCLGDFDTKIVSVVSLFLAVNQPKYHLIFYFNYFSL